jgi:ribonuclease HI
MTPKIRELSFKGESITLKLFTDGSAHPQSKVGYGAYVLIEELEESLDEIASRIQLKRFNNTSSTKLELQTLLWALQEIDSAVDKIIIYTDSQNTVSLLQRRERFERNNYASKKKERIANAKLYQEFYTLMDRYHCELIKVRGHPERDQKDRVDTIFTLVDRASRNALREYLAESK